MVGDGAGAVGGAGAEGYAGADARIDAARLRQKARGGAHEQCGEAAVNSVIIGHEDLIITCLAQTDVSQEEEGVGGARNVRAGGDPLKPQWGAAAGFDDEQHVVSCVSDLALGLKGEERR